MPMSLASNFPSTELAIFLVGFQLISNTRNTSITEAFAGDPKSFDDQLKRRKDHCTTDLNRIISGVVLPVLNKIKNHRNTRIRTAPPNRSDIEVKFRRNLEFQGKSAKLEMCNRYYSFLSFNTSFKFWLCSLCAAIRE